MISERIKFLTNFLNLKLVTPRFSPPEKVFLQICYLKLAVNCQKALQFIEKSGKNISQYHRSYNLVKLFLEIHIFFLKICSRKKYQWCSVENWTQNDKCFAFRLSALLLIRIVANFI
jgi:hypothetical protein